MVIFGILAVAVLIQMLWSWGVFDKRDVDPEFSTYNTVVVSYLLVFMTTSILYMATSWHEKMQPTTFIVVNFGILTTILLLVQVLWTFGVINPPNSSQAQILKTSPAFKYFNVSVVLTILVAIFLFLGQTLWSQKNSKKKK